MSIPAVAVEDEGVKEQFAALLAAVLTKSLEVIPLTASLNRRRIANRRLVGRKLEVFVTNCVGFGTLTVAKTMSFAGDEIPKVS